jgi:hypothetical protein
MRSLIYFVLFNISFVLDYSIQKSLAASVNRSSSGGETRSRSVYVEESPKSWSASKPSQSLDERVQGIMERQHIPGMAVVIIHNGVPEFKNYGVANFAQSWAWPGLVCWQF